MRIPPLFELTKPQLELIVEIIDSHSHYVRNEIFESTDNHPTLPQDEIDYYECIRALRNELAERVGFQADDSDWYEFSADEDPIEVEGRDGSLTWEQAKTIGK